MLPEIYRAEAIANEIVAERERRLEKRQLLAELPTRQPILSVVLHHGAEIIGKHMIRAGERLSKYGHSETTSRPWTRQARVQGTSA